MRGVAGARFVPLTPRVNGPHSCVHDGRLGAPADQSGPDLGFLFEVQQASLRKPAGPALKFAAMLMLIFATPCVLYTSMFRTYGILEMPNWRPDSSSGLKMLPSTAILTPLGLYAAGDRPFPNSIDQCSGAQCHLLQ
eukprot:325593-Chlamydomonas_euryale.AAC.5